MKTILQRLYQGEFFTDHIIPDSPEWERDLNAYAQHSQGFKESLNKISADLADTYDALEREQDELFDYDGEALFTHAFALGAMLMLDILKLSRS